jgi:hypothetical protein
LMIISSRSLDRDAVAPPAATNRAAADMVEKRKGRLPLLCGGGGLGC